MKDRSLSPKADPESFPARSGDDARLDAELARMDEPTSDARAEALSMAHRRGLGSYVKMYARVSLPFALALGVFKALQGGSPVEVTGSVIGATLIAGVVSFVIHGVRTAKRTEGAKPEPMVADARPEASATTTIHDERHYDARLDDELKRVDGYE